MRAATRARASAGAFAVMIGLLLTGCAAGEQQPDPVVTDSGAPAAESTEDAALIDCVRDRGWEIVVDDEGWGAPGISEAQFDVYVADVEECGQLTSVIEPLEDISQERWEQAYARTVETARCLRGQGYDVPETPSFQVWQDSYFADESGAGQWVPWLFVPVPSMSSEEFRALEAICPQPAGP